MPIHGLSHYNFRLERSLMETVKKFYEDVLDLRAGPRPAFRSRGYWLYAGDRDLLHLTEQAPDDPRRAGSDLTFDHVALESSDWPALRGRLIQHAVSFKEDRVPGSGVLQIFFRDPAGNGVELIFPRGEA